MEETKIKRLRNFLHGLHVASRFSDELKGQGWRIALVLGLLLSTIALELIRPWPLKWVIDRVLVVKGPRPENASTLIYASAAALGLILVAKALADYFATLRMKEVGHTVTRSLRLKIFRHLVELSPSFHARNKSGDLLMRLLGDVTLVKDMMVDASIQIGVRVLQTLGILVVMININPSLALIVFLPLPFLVLVIRFLSQRLTVAVRKQRRKEGEMADYIHEAISATPVVQSLGGGVQVIRQFAQTNRRNERAGLKTARAAASLSGSVEILLALAFAAAVGYGGNEVLDGNLKLGELTVFLSYVRSILKPIRAAAKHQGKIAKGAASGERILAVLDEDIELRTDAGSLLPAEAPRTLVFDSVGYDYPNGHQALNDVSIRCMRGEVTALVGESGAGKSTLVSLAIRLFDPTRGQVKLDGVCLRDLDLDELRKRFSISMQSTVLFGESIRENLALGAPDASDEQMWQALEEAGVTETVRAQAEGLGAVLGSSGVGMSGGESSRLCLARALLRQAPILIVDEPFAGLDQDTASVVAHTLHQYGQTHMVLIITHHLDQFESVDRIYQLKNGKITQSTPTRLRNYKS